jgi:hypothetical protein
MSMAGTDPRHVPPAPRRTSPAKKPAVASRATRRRGKARSRHPPDGRTGPPIGGTCAPGGQPRSSAGKMASPDDGASSTDDDPDAPADRAGSAEHRAGGWFRSTGGSTPAFRAAWSGCLLRRRSPCRLALRRLAARRSRARRLAAGALARPGWAPTRRGRGRGARDPDDVPARGDRRGSETAPAVHPEGASAQQRARPVQAYLLPTHFPPTTFSRVTGAVMLARPPRRPRAAPCAGSGP